jgi:ribonucleotide reductase alpha subunit
LPGIELTDNARQVLKRRYVRRGDDGQPAESIDEMFWRVAYHVARVEEKWGGDVIATARAYYRLLTSKSFFPNSPTFTGAGTPLGQLAACFVLPISDDMGRRSSGIFQTLRDAALIQQTGGGNGFSFSRLRPKKSLVKSSSGEATGPVGFLRVYDHAFGEVAQGGSRRGANMAVLRVDHPDVEEFISCKTDENSITNFNISVGITDAFMEAVEADADWDLIFPDVQHPAYRNFDGTLEQARAAGIPLRVHKTVKARELFTKIVQQAHHNGEPGMLFLDAANRSNPVPHLYQLEATNPCFIGTTRIATHQGLLTIAEMAAAETENLIAVDERAHSGAGVSFRPASPAWLTRQNAPVYHLVTREGYTVTATPDHKFLTPQRGYVALEDLQVGDSVLIQSGEGAWSRNYELPNRVEVAEAMATMGQGGDRASGKLTTRADFAHQYENLPTRWSHDLGFVVGTLVGDGWLSPSSNSPVGMVFGKDKSEALELVQNAMQFWFRGGHLHERESVDQLTYGHLPYQFFASLGVLAAPAHQKQVPEALWQAPREAVIGFLQGLFTADGTVNLTESKRSCSVRLASASAKLLEEVQLLLLNLGIAGKIHMRRPAPVGVDLRVYPGRTDNIYPENIHAVYPGRTHRCAPTTDYELILDKANRDLFLEKVGFIDSAKQSKAADFVASKARRSNREDFTATVARIEAAGQADVYDLTEPYSHSLIANGFVAHNCGEQWLGSYENCCLGSVNLATCLGPDGSVDWDKLSHDVTLATRFLDDVVDANQYVPSVPALSEAAHRARRIGLGMMGLSDLMYHCKIRYGSPAGQEFAAQVIEFVRYHAMQTSVALAKERGAFPAFVGSIYELDGYTEISRGKGLQGELPPSPPAPLPGLPGGSAKREERGAMPIFAALATEVGRVPSAPLAPRFALPQGSLGRGAGGEGKQQSGNTLPGDPKRWTPPTPLAPFTRDFGRPGIDWDTITDGIRMHGIRNAAQTTIAPTGTIATVAGCEGYGCEPVFALAYVRHVNDKGTDLTLTYASPLFERALEQAGIDPEQRKQIFEQVTESGSCQNVSGVPQAIREVFAVSGDISASEHVQMQAAMQAFVDNSLSKTVNFPPGATEEDVATAYLLAWKLGCKGITVYVTGSRDKVVLETKGTAEKKQAPTAEAAAPAEAPAKAAVTSEQPQIWHDLKKPRPRCLTGYTYSIETPLGKAFVTINENGGSQPFEVFVNTSKAGSETAAVSESLGRLVSYILRLASPVEPSLRLNEVYRQLAGIGGGRSLGFGPNRVRSLPDGLAQALEDYLGQRTTRMAAAPSVGEAVVPAVPVSQPATQPLLKIGDLCPECGQAAVVNEEGCRKCYACGYSEC